MTSVAQAIFRVVTEAATALFSLVGTRVWVGHAPRGGAGKFTNTVAAIVFTPLPVGKSHASGGYHRSVVEFKCYGGSTDILDAETVYRALWDQLQLKSGTFTGSTIINCTEVLAGNPQTEPETEYPVYIGQFEFEIEES